MGFLECPCCYQFPCAVEAVCKEPTMNNQAKQPLTKEERDALRELVTYDCGIGPMLVGRLLDDLDRLSAVADAAADLSLTDYDDRWKAKWGRLRDTLRAAGRLK